MVIRLWLVLQVHAVLGSTINLKKIYVVVTMIRDVKHRATRTSLDSPSGIREVIVERAKKSIVTYTAPIEGPQETINIYI